MLIAKNSLLPLFLFLALVVMALPSAVFAQTPPADTAQDEALEQEAQAIDRMIMCPVCPAETIDQAQVEISFQMRAVVREMLAEGRTREEILDYFADRYGADILAAPPKSGANLLAWILPIVGVAAGLGALYLVIRAMTGGKPARVPATPAAPEDPASGAASEIITEPQTDDPELSPYLEIVDRRLASRRSMRPEPGQGYRPGVSPADERNSGRETGNNG